VYAPRGNVTVRGHFLVAQERGITLEEQLELHITLNEKKIKYFFILATKAKQSKAILGSQLRTP
jgi:hypothetical protein